VGYEVWTRESSIEAGRVGPLVTPRGFPPPQELAASKEVQVSGRISISAPFRMWILAARPDCAPVLVAQGDFVDGRPPDGPRDSSDDHPLDPPTTLLIRTPSEGGLTHWNEV